MPVATLDIQHIPELAVPMGAYGSINRPEHMSGSMFDFIVAVILILFDDENPAGG